MASISPLSIMLISSIFFTTLTAKDSVENLAVASAPTDISLTIYNNNLAMISEKRTAKIEQSGRVKLMYPGIPSSIDTSSVIASFTQDTKLFSQNYSFDVISYNSLMNYHLGKTVHYTEKEASIEIKEGILLSTSPLLIREKNYGAIYIPHKLFFPNIPKDMAVKPSLFWNIETSANRLDIDLKYLTAGMSWRSDYTMNLIDDRKLNLNSWITIDNHSGATYPNATITVLAGEVQKPKPSANPRIYAKRALPSPSVESSNILNESFSGYHIYKIPFKESINDKEKKQISFIQKEDIEYQKYALNSQRFYFSNFGKRKLQFNQIVEFENSKKNHLGIPLPKGTIRVYKEDSSSVSRFVGAHNIGNIPKDEKVKIVLGKYFDIIGEERVTEYQETSKKNHITYVITVKNRSEEQQTIKIRKNVPTNKGKLTMTDSCEKLCSKKSINAFTTLYTLELKAGKEYDLTLSYDIMKY
jgi:hypothetical protein